MKIAPDEGGLLELYLTGAGVFIERSRTIVATFQPASDPQHRQGAVRFCSGLARFVALLTFNIALL